MIGLTDPQIFGLGFLAAIVVALVIVGYFALSEAWGTPDDHEIGTDRWPRLDDK